MVVRPSTEAGEETAVMMVEGRRRVASFEYSDIPSEARRCAGERELNSLDVTENVFRQARRDEITINKS